MCPNWVWGAPISRALRTNSTLPNRLTRRSSEARRHGETAMDYDWFWVLLALGIFIPAGTVPLAMARDACRWWRDQRGEREIAGPHL
jgi:hypothetical protein